jgi:hypothetical protein
MDNRRTLYLALIAAILAIFVIVRPRVQRERPAETVDVVLVKEDIDPYKTISSSQLYTTTMEAVQGQAYYNDPEALDGGMSTTFLKSAQPIRREDVLPPELFRFVADMKYEILSFQGSFSEMVGGQVRPGHRINIYGYRRGAGPAEPGEMEMVADNVLVVGVRSASGADAAPQAQDVQAAETQDQGGLFSPASLGVGGGGDQDPATVLIVAAEPGVVHKIIADLGSRDYMAWVTLAPQFDRIVVPTPLYPATETPVPPTPTVPPTMAPPTATPESPAVTATPQAVLEGSIYMSWDKDGEERTRFHNSTSSLWAVANLDYAPAGPMPIRIEILCANGDVIFTLDDTHSAPGRQSYYVNRAQGFPADTLFITTLYAGGKSFQVEWTTSGDATLPPTGDETVRSGGQGGGGS